MKTKILLLLFFLMLADNPVTYAAAQVQTCEVTYKAERVITERVWLNTVTRKEFKEGKEVGTGQDKKSCGIDALKKLENAGWVITFRDVKMT